MKRETYSKIAESTEHDDYLLSEVRMIFVEGIEACFPENEREIIEAYLNDEIRSAVAIYLFGANYIKEIELSKLSKLSELQIDDNYEYADDLCDALMDAQFEGDTGRAMEIFAGAYLYRMPVYVICRSYVHHPWIYYLCKKSGGAVFTSRKAFEQYLEDIGLKRF